jgi:hypothetical protein
MKDAQDTLQDEGGTRELDREELVWHRVHRISEEEADCQLDEVEELVTKVEPIAAREKVGPGTQQEAEHKRNLEEQAVLLDYELCVSYS